jgi:hypothetical protein
MKTRPIGLSAAARLRLQLLLSNNLASKEPSRLLPVNLRLQVPLHLQTVNDTLIESRQKSSVKVPGFPRNCLSMARELLERFVDHTQ